MLLNVGDGLHGEEMGDTALIRQEIAEHERDCSERRRSAESETSRRFDGRFNILDKKFDALQKEIQKEMLTRLPLWATLFISGLAALSAALLTHALGGLK